MLARKWVGKCRFCDLGWVQANSPATQCYRFMSSARWFLLWPARMTLRWPSLRSTSLVTSLQTAQCAFHFQRSLPLSGHHCHCLLSSMPVVQANLSILQIQACQTSHKGFHVAHQIKSRLLNLSLNDLTSDYPFSLMAHHYFIAPPMLLLQMHRVLNVNLSDWACTHTTPFLASFLLPCCTHWSFQITKHLSFRTLSLIIYSFLPSPEHPRLFSKTVLIIFIMEQMPSNLRYVSWKYENKKKNCGNWNW